MIIVIMIIIITCFAAQCPTCALHRGESKLLRPSNSARPTHPRILIHRPAAMRVASSFEVFAGSKAKSVLTASRCNMGFCGPLQKALLASGSSAGCSASPACPGPRALTSCHAHMVSGHLDHLGERLLCNLLQPGTHGTCMSNRWSPKRKAGQGRLNATLQWCQSALGRWSSLVSCLGQFRIPLFEMVLTGHISPVQGTASWVSRRRSS